MDISYYLDITLCLELSPCSGNIPGERPYRTGTPCSECPVGLDRCEANICSSKFLHMIVIVVTPQAYG